jgi:hypothetical protein
MTAALQNTGMHEDAAWYDYWFIPSLQQPKNKAATTHTKDEAAAIAIPHGTCSYMTEDIEEAVESEQPSSNHSGDPRRRSALHEESRDTSSSREEVPPSRIINRSASFEEAPKNPRGLPMGGITMPSSSQAKKTNSAAQLEQRLLHS